MPIRKPLVHTHYLLLDSRQSKMKHTVCQTTNRKWNSRQVRQAMVIMPSCKYWRKSSPSERVFSAAGQHTWHHRFRDDKKIQHPLRHVTCVPLVPLSLLLPPSALFLHESRIPLHDAGTLLPTPPKPAICISRDLKPSSKQDGHGIS